MEPLMEDDKEKKKKKTSRPKLHVEDLATRIIKSSKGENYEEVCIKNVFERIKFESNALTRRLVIPDPDITVSLPSKIADNLKSMGITQLLPTQRYTLPILVDHDSDVFVEAATGHGKTLAFLIPIAVALLRAHPRPNSSSGRPRALVIANTQVLQVQTLKVCQELLKETGLRAVLVCGETPTQEQAREIERGVDVVIATTGRLLQFLKEQKLFLTDLQYYVFDEADKMTRAEAFKNEVEQIDTFIPPEIKSNLRSCFFTATLDWMQSFNNMFREDKYSVIRCPGNPLITHRIIPLCVKEVNDVYKSQILMNLLQKDLEAQGRTLFDKSRDPYLQKTVVFVGEKIKCNFLSSYLRMYGFSVGVANSDLSLSVRNKIIQRFCKGEMQALIATDSMARGHDIPNVTHVINYDMGDTLETFKHRAGRTARIGHKGTCTTFLSKPAFHLYDHIDESDRQRQKAAQLASYLVLECGQRIPDCLAKSALTALRAKFIELKLPMTADEYLEKTFGKNDGTEEVEEKEENGENMPSIAKEKKIVRAKQLAPSQKEEKRMEKEKEKEKEREKEMEKEKEREESEKEEEKEIEKVHKVLQDMDIEGTPIFDPSETERESSDEEDDNDEENEEDEEDEDIGAVSFDEGEYKEDEYFSSSQWGTDSDSEAPKASDSDSNDTIEAEDEKGEIKPLRWTDDEDEDFNAYGESRSRALIDDYEKSVSEKEEGDVSEMEGDEDGGNNVLNRMNGVGINGTHNPPNEVNNDSVD